eukprot:1223934-Pleurochrysis_carterae.AAC.3
MFVGLQQVVPTLSAYRCTVFTMVVEQMLTTGGGWQDQVGGIVPGIKRCSSAAKLPLVVETK